MFFCSTSTRHRMRHGIRHAAALAWRRFRPCVANGRLRHRLIGSARVSTAAGSQLLALPCDALQTAATRDLSSPGRRSWCGWCCRWGARRTADGEPRGGRAAQFFRNSRQPPSYGGLPKTRSVCSIHTSHARTGEGALSSLGPPAAALTVATSGDRTIYAGQFKPFIPFKERSPGMKYGGAALAVTGALVAGLWSHVPVMNAITVAPTLGGLRVGTSVGF